MINSTLKSHLSVQSDSSVVPRLQQHVEHPRTRQVCRPQWMYRGEVTSQRVRWTSMKSEATADPQLIEMLNSLSGTKCEAASAVQTGAEWPVSRRPGQRASPAAELQVFLQLSSFQGVVYLHINTLMSHRCETTQSFC